jgi:hypothetical protein
MKHADVRIWGFCGGLIGLLLAWEHLKMPWIGDGIRINSIELITEVGGFAAIGAILAYFRNRMGNR